MFLTCHGMSTDLFVAAEMAQPKNLSEESPIVLSVLASCIDSLITENSLANILLFGTSK